MMNIHTNLRLKRHFSLLPYSSNSVELRYGVWNPVSFTITDEAQSGHLFNLLSRLDGTCSPAQLAHAEGIEQDEVEALLEYLQRLDLVEDGACSAFDYYLDTIIPTLASGQQPPTTTRPVIVMGNRDCAQPIVSSLQCHLPNSAITLVSDDDPAWQTIIEADSSWLAQGKQFHERLAVFDAWQGHLLIFVTKLIHPVQLQILNRITWELNIPWLHAAFDGPFLFVGPTFVPHCSACYECFECRVMLNLRENAGYLRYKQALVNRECKPGAIPVEGVLSGVLAAHVAMEALNYLLTQRSFTINKVLAIYLPTLEFTYNEVLKVPGCAGCSPLAQRDEESLYFDIHSLIQNDKTTLPFGREHAHADQD